MTSATIGVVEKSCQDFLLFSDYFFELNRGLICLVLLGNFVLDTRLRLNRKSISLRDHQMSLRLQQQLSRGLSSFQIAVRLFRLR
jgi:hypothetical protein